MRKAMRKTVWRLALLLLPLPLFGSYNWSPTLSLADNTANCATFNCLTSIGGVATAIGAGADGTVYAANQAHILYSYNMTTRAWAQAPAALQIGVTRISVASATQVAIVSDATFPNPNVYVLNAAGTGWTGPLGTWWCWAVSIARDGTLACLGESLNVFLWNGTSWPVLAGSGQVTIPMETVSVAGVNGIFAVDSSSRLWQWGGTAWSQMTVSGFTPNSQVDTTPLVASGENLISMLDTNGGIHISENEGQSWTKIQGTATSIAGAGVTGFALGASGTVYHINAVVPALTGTGAGFWPCPPADGCPAGSYHTLYAYASFGGKGGAHGTGGVLATASGSPETQLSAPAIETAANCDPFFGDPSAPECQGYYWGNAACSVMGSLGGIAQTPTPPILGAGLAQTGAALQGIAWRDALGDTYCPVVTNCTPATTPPLCASGTPVIVPYDPFVTIGTAQTVCKEHNPWVEYIPWISINPGSGPVTQCSWLGIAEPNPGTGPYSCTTSTAPGVDMDK
jgi:hypothetical protein